jgi:hypothetical protein
MTNMPDPFEFGSRKQLRKTLGSSKVKKEFKSFFSSRRFEGHDKLIKASADQNTVRAFHHSPYGLKIGLLKLYRELAARFLKKELKNWRKIRTREEMRGFVLKQAEGLRKDWLKRTKREGYGFDIGIGRAAKLLNLLLKHLTLSSQLSQKERKRLIPLLEVPLDKYTLRGIRRLCPRAKIPKTASMGFVQHKEQYIDLQNAIFELCDPYYPAHYEIAVWNASHG